MDKSGILLTEMGKRILSHRKSMGLSQEELAELADVSPQLLSTAERGSKAIRPENLLKISNALGVSADYLLTGVIVDKDISTISNKLKSVSPEQLRTIEKIIDQCISLCEQD